ncbi:MAG TPA: tetratricopeptide repeat protein [Blastocatellia bacterium]|nr:tetratricopeptide repeat protein [Blastocatellia bacterium]
MRSRKFYCGVVLILFGLLSSSGSFAQRRESRESKEAEEYHRAGLSYYESGQYEKAVEAYERAILKKPAREDYYFNLAMAYSSLGRYKDAVSAYNTAIRIKPDYTVAYFNLGHAYSNIKKYERAVRAFKQAIKHDPDNIEAYFSLATAYFDSGKEEMAVATYEEAIRRNPGNPYAYFNLGLVYFPVGPHARAVDAFSQAIIRDPRYSEAYFHRAYSYLFMGRGESAASDAETYLSLKEWRGERVLDMAIVGYFGYIQARQEASARKLLEDAVRANGSKDWPYPVIEYLLREIPDQVLLNNAPEGSPKVEAKAYIGLDLSLRGEQKAALDHLKWVKKHTYWGSLMHSLAVSEMERIKASSALSSKR